LGLKRDVEAVVEGSYWEAQEMRGEVKEAVTAGAQHAANGLDFADAVEATWVVSGGKETWILALEEPRVGSRCVRWLAGF
jgi:hypothetical protein